MFVESGRSFLLFLGDLAPVVSGPLGLSLDFWQKVVIAVLSATMSFAAAYGLDFAKRRREPTKQLSLEESTKEIIPDLDQELRSKIKVLYNDKLLVGLHNSRIRIENTGNRVVQSQRVRFTWSSSSSVLERTYSPELPELGVVVTDESKAHELVYTLGQLEKGQSVDFTFLVNSPQKPELLIVSSNPTGDVETLSKASRRSISEREALTHFVRAVIMFATLPYVAFLIPYRELADITAAGIRVGILLVMLPDVPKVARFLAGLLDKIRNDNANSLHVQGSALTDSVLIVNSDAASVVRMRTPAELNPLVRLSELDE